MTYHTYKDLTKEMRWKIAEKLAEERLDKVNSNIDDVIIPNTFYMHYGKRIIGFMISLFVLLVTIPLNLIIGIITFFDVGWPLFFIQVRTGKDGKPIQMIKFRNMRIEYDERGELLPVAQRVTKWGIFVRKTSLDELLNFWLILKGDMSIIGPRPLPPEYDIRYNKRHKARLCVRPGLECPPWIIKNEKRTWQDRLDNDVWYVEHISLKTDLMMFIRLIQYTFSKKNYIERAETGGDTFEGYSEDGRVITVEQIPQKYIDEMFDN